MTIKQVINVLDEFRDGYNASADPDIKKLCHFIDNTVNGLQMYENFFTKQKSTMENNKQYCTDTLAAIESLLE